MPQVSNGRGARDRMAGAGEQETKIQNAANWKHVGSLNKGTFLTQVRRERFLGSCEDAILAKPDLGVKRGSGVCPTFVCWPHRLRSAPFTLVILAAIGHAATGKCVGVTRVSSCRSRAQSDDR